MLPPTRKVMKIAERLRNKLGAVYIKRNATAAEIRAVLDSAQVDVEELWDNTTAPGQVSRCGEPGCNYRRYPIAPFCLYHSKGKDSLAARLRRVESRTR